ncbi:hypothetical protein B0H14DRAFT_3714840 [Mycena olivaceomarginata]|nr:hypothetical protein B0H14DRAFT_3714840 [Mycena olivaceomarginata]
MLALALSLVVHALVFFYFFIAPVSAHCSAANTTYPPFPTLPYHPSPEDGLTHSHTFRLTVALGVACLIYSARALGSAVCVSSCIASLLLHSAYIELTSRRLSVLQIVYEDDIKTHGDPAKSQHKTGNGVSTGSPKWLQQLHVLAPLVQRFSRRQGTKRRRPASFDEEEEDNRDGDEPEEPNRESGGDQPDHVEGDGGDEGSN